MLASSDLQPKGSTRVYGIYIYIYIYTHLGAQMGSHIPTSRPKYIPHSYMDPLGKHACSTSPTGRAPVFVCLELGFKGLGSSEL